MAAVQPLEGIISIEVHFISNQAVVTYQPAIIDGAEIGEAIENSGYGATLWRDVKLEAEASRPFDIRTIDIEIHGYNEFVTEFSDFFQL
jgi:hypothetical protein